MPLLEMQGISKTFPGVKALDRVDFELLAGEVHALVGENGAGKSTLMKILAGAETPDEGEIRLEGKTVQIQTPQQAIRLGIAMIFQEFNLAPHLSVMENLFLGHEPRRFGWVQFRRMEQGAHALLKRVGLNLSPHARVGTLSVAQQQMVEIAKALSRNARLIIMDEPSATLTQHELQTLFDLIRQLQSEGIGVIYISHRLEEVFGIADRVTVLRDGRRIATAPVREVTRDQLIQWMVGRELEERTRPASTSPELHGSDRSAPPLLEVRNLSRRGVLRNVSFRLSRYEIVGLAGLVGSGRTELARALYGADPFDEGELLWEGRPIRIRSPQDAVRLGIGLLTEDRKAQGLVLPMNLRENLTLSKLQAVARAGFLRLSEERRVAEEYRHLLSIRTPSVEQAVRWLSGGNQQKVVIAKWLFSQCRLLIFDEPTRGVDVGAKREIHHLIRQLAAQGVGILLISSELPEVLALSDRILVMRAGRIEGELPAAEATQEKILRLATGFF